MKKVLLLACLVIFLFGCRNQKPRETDVVNGITPVQHWDNSTYDLLDSLKRIPDNAKLQFIKKNLPYLTPALCRYIEERFKNHSIDSIVYSFGTGKAKGVLDSAGIRHNGVFSNELIAYVWLKPTKLVKVFVRCLNGTFEIEGDKRLGAISNEFVIQPGEGLCHHLDFATSIWLAKKFNLPLFKGKVFKAKYRITPNQAKQISTSRKQISVLVYAGDRFRLFGNEAGYTPARRR